MTTPLRFPYSRIRDSSFAFLFASLFASLFAPSTFASDFSLAINPPVLQIQATPPASIKALITLKNLNEKPQDLQYTFKPFIAKDNNGQINFIPDENLGDLSQLIAEKIQLKENDEQIDSIHLDPYESKDITLNINIGKNDPLGDYYFSIIFMSEKEGLKNQNKSFTKIPAGIGNLVLLSVGQKGKTQGHIGTFETPTFLTEGPVPLTLLLTNTSDHLIQPKGTILITNTFGKTVGKLDILPSHILSGSSRYLTDLNQASPSAATLAFLKKLNSNHDVLVWNEKYLLGFYTAKLTISLSDEGPKFITYARFFALPTTFIAGFVFILIILINVYLKVKRKI